METIEKGTEGFRLGGYKISKLIDELAIFHSIQFYKYIYTKYQFQHWSGTMRSTLGDIITILMNCSLFDMSRFHCRLLADTSVCTGYGLCRWSLCHAMF